MNVLWDIFRQLVSPSYAPTNIRPDEHVVDIRLTISMLLNLRKLKLEDVYLVFRFFSDAEEQVFLFEHLVYVFHSWISRIYLIVSS